MSATEFDALAQNRIDAIELSGGVLIGGKLAPSRMGIKTEDKEAYFQPAAAAFKQQIDVHLNLAAAHVEEPAGPSPFFNELHTPPFPIVTLPQTPVF